MKKEKARSESKKLKKELENKLMNAFTAIAEEYSKVKNSKAVIEKFTKQLSKKIDLKNKPVIIAEEAVPIKEKTVKAKTAKSL